MIKMVDFNTYKEMQTFDRLIHCIALFKSYIINKNCENDWELIFSSLDKIHKKLFNISRFFNFY